MGTGTLVNVAAIAAGSLVGVFLRKGIPANVKGTLTQGLGLAVILLGLQMAFKTQNALIVIASLAIGGVIGELTRIEERLDNLGQWIQQKTSNGSGENKVAGAFVIASLIYCVGAMAVMGAIEDGLTGQPKILFAKSMLDGIASVIFASTMGIGVIFSTVPVLLYQGAITLAASAASTYLSDWVIAELTATGGLLIIGIGLNILELAKIRVGNLLPAIFVAAGIVIVIERCF
ncbi:MAG: DUF554 domain-containing protein [Peptococcaceae bacterium]|nr:DUF554 domain-containing protein [Peptococcaceae bacterium]